MVDFETFPADFPLNLIERPEDRSAHKGFETNLLHITYTNIISTLEDYQKQKISQFVDLERRLARSRIYQIDEL